MFRRHAEKTLLEWDLQGANRMSLDKKKTIKQSYHELSNEELLELYQNLDKSAFDEFFRRHSPMVLSYLAARLSAKAEAEEVLQEVFFRIHYHILKYDPNQNALGWVFAIAKNCLFDWLRKKKRQKDVLLDWEEHQKRGREVAAFQSKAKESLWELFERLSLKDQGLLWKRFFKEKSFAELASELQISEAGVRQRVSRILRKLRQVS